MESCQYCRNPMIGTLSACPSCGAFQMRRRTAEVKLPAPIYKLLLEWVESDRRYQMKPTRPENRAGLDFHYNGRDYHFSLDV